MIFFNQQNNMTKLRHDIGRRGRGEGRGLLADEQPNWASSAEPMMIPTAHSRK